MLGKWLAAAVPAAPGDGAANAIERAGAPPLLEQETGLFPSVDRPAENLAGHNNPSAIGGASTVADGRAIVIAAESPQRQPPQRQPPDRQVDPAAEPEQLLGPVDRRGRRRERIWTHEGNQ
jgi:hypothetical protein